MTPQEEKPGERRTKSPEQALASLMRLCARAEKCESDARRLLRGWGIGEEEASRIVERLIRDRFIDDGRYAAAFVREKLRLSGWGEYKIRAALTRKGIDRALIDRELAGFDREGMHERLQAQLARKARTVRQAAPRELKAKLIWYGLSLGYDYGTVIETVSTMIEDNEPCEPF